MQETRIQPNNYQHKSRDLVIKLSGAQQKLSFLEFRQYKTEYKYTNTNWRVPKPHFVPKIVSKLKNYQLLKVHELSRHQASIKSLQSGLNSWNWPRKKKTGFSISPLSNYNILFWNRDLANSGHLNNVNITNHLFSWII